MRMLLLGGTKDSTNIIEHVKNNYDENAITIAEKFKEVKKNEDDIRVSDKIINILKKQS